MILVNDCNQAMPVMEEFLAILNLNRREFAAIKQKSGINPREVSRLLKQVKKYHRETYQHSLNVSRLSALLAHRLNMTAIDVYAISIGALLHDIGKITLPHAILDKKSRLNIEEWEQVKKHPEAGVTFISRYAWAKQLESMILLHHERLDGKGYYGLLEEKIPLPARIITIADAFDAMASPRPYQERRDIQGCWQEIERCSGTQFDPDLLPEFYSVITRSGK